MIPPTATACCLVAFTLMFAASHAADSPAPGDTVRVTKGAMLEADGKSIVLAPKGGEWRVLRSSLGRNAVEVAFVKEDGAVIGAMLPTENVELCASDGDADLQAAMDAFAAMQVAEAKRLFERAAADEKTKVLAGALGGRVMGAIGASQRAGTDAGRQAFVNTLLTLRTSAQQLVQAGRLGLALAMDQGTDKLAAQVFQNAPGAPTTKLDRADLEKRVAVSSTAVRRARQAFALRKLVTAGKAANEGLAAEPGRTELAKLVERMKKDMEEADDCWVQADKMRTRGQKGVIHALSSLDDGIRLCADHPKLLALRSAMQSEFEGRTSPQVTNKFLAITKGSKGTMEDGRKLYTSRCTECHDLEMLDTRGEDGWQRMVSGMSRRAGLDSSGEGKIMAYLAAALKYVEATGGE